MTLKQKLGAQKAKVVQFILDAQDGKVTKSACVSYDAHCKKCNSSQL